MSLLEIVNTLLLKPIELFFEIIYMVAYDVTDNPGISIIILSLVMNFLLLPLYNRADKIQEEERDIENKLHDGVAHIKKTFRGDERMMVLQTYYRQNHYKPTYVLRGAVSLLLEIPFFMAAYAFLSKLELLEGVSFGPIRNLGEPDALFVIAGISINVLPILMTLINIIASLMYTKGAPAKAKVQLYVMAIIFLVVLYSSPSGLVFYWTMNNLFSLIKTIVNKLKSPIRFLRIGSSLLGFILMAVGVVCYSTAIKLELFFIGIGLLLQFPLAFYMIKKRIKYDPIIRIKHSNFKIVLCSGLFLTILIGLLIPSSVIVASPQEFIDINYFYHPLKYIFYSFCLSFGTFFLWSMLFYFFVKKSGKIFLEFSMLLLAIISLMDYMFFGKKLGLLSSTLKYNNGLNIRWQEQLINILLIIVLVGILYIIVVKWERRISRILLIGCIALLCMSAINIANINKSILTVKEEMLSAKSDTPRFKLSKSSKNVIVLMLDRAFGGYVPYLINEKPEIKEKFDGFTYYSNVISYGGHTNFGVPALLGGYEYTPMEMNKREDELLVDKHNEALKVMPTLFSNNGYDVTVADPPYANYQWFPDLSIYDGIKNVKACVTNGKFSDVSKKEKMIKSNCRNFFCYSMMKSLPLCLQDVLYQDGTYRQSDILEEEPLEQITKSNYCAEGLNPYFMDAYNVLKALPFITDIEEDSKGQFIFLLNNTTHDAMLLQEPEYVPRQKVDNTNYEVEKRYEVNGKTLKMETEVQYKHYQSNMAAFIELGKWFDYLKENGVYDNTRIILVADHGYEFAHFDNFIMDGVEDMEYYYPLLMVKDFDSKGFNVSEEFMTNGDAPILAMKDIVENPVNPYTGKIINDDIKKKGKQYIIGSHEHDVEKNNGKTFMPSVWYSVHDNIWDKNNWEIVEEEDIFP